jgi:hypothetical protein
MKSKIAFAIFALLMSGNVFAADPNVSCEMMYGRVDANGVNDGGLQFKSVVVTSSGSTATLNGFELEAKTTRVCATDGGPCSDNYDFSVSLKKNESKSGMFVSLQPNEVGWNRYSTSLKIGNEELFVNCDYETRQ